MSLRLTFLAFKKSCTSCPNWGERGEVIGTESKRTATFFRETFPEILKIPQELTDLLAHRCALFLCSLDVRQLTNGLPA